MDGAVSDFYFDNSYIDLTKDNPFWNSNENKPAYLGQNGELPTGSAPLIYLPLRADAPGKNKGTGGDFTVNGTLEGARGPSEFWANSAEFDGSSPSGILNTNPVGPNTTKRLSTVLSFKTEHNNGTNVGYPLVF